MTPELDEHLRTVVAALKHGEVIPFLGAGANLVNRPAGMVFNADNRNALPNGAELATWLAAEYDLVDLPPSDATDLVRVAEWISLQHGEMSMYERLGELLDADYPITSLHELLATLPRLVRENGWKPLQLVVTTNYDDLLERAFRAAGEEFDVLTYMAAGPEEGQFCHYKSNGESDFVRPGTANEYDLEMDGPVLRRPVILKLHGAIDRPKRERDSFVISEDDYIEYLALMDVEKLVPIHVKKLLKKYNYLFLGYSLRDWNVRAILHQMWSLRRLTASSWAIQSSPKKLDHNMWNQRRVEILAADLDEYVAALGSRLGWVRPAHEPLDG